MNKEKIIRLLLFLLPVSYQSCNNFSAGSYPYAERYEINAKEKILIKIVQKFKDDNPQYTIPQKVTLEDGKHVGDGGHWYHVYFYFSKENQIISTWIRAINKNKTTFAFVGVDKGLTLGNWKEINKDFSSLENDMQKKKFEDRILTPIKNKLQNYE